ncbi:hypothetical protein [Amycolatopsis suaedae]|uniref:TolB n=1 Tax=Amycolatopsis suaedae TaxID=2510978 RepID=A0A4V2EM90_9PSEU|nr:hypothetical protein [Amycolatopsis suaedae]RZQ64235.1 hypothetical protein EWH70_09645 [Amycolatopsis suaedae]
MRVWLTRHRIAVGVSAIVVVVLALSGYLAVTLSRDRAGAAAAAAGDLLFVDLADGRDIVQTLRPDGSRADTALRCQRVYTAGGTTVCLRLAGPGPRYEVAVSDASGAVLRTVGLPGIPNRARVSRSGKIISWTTFVTGDSYTVPGGFSTRTGVLDLRTGTVVESLEDFATTVNGQPLLAADRNFWGVTVADDDRTFYATVASAERTWLVRGDLAARTMHAVRPGVECPSLSPDGKSLAYKKRTSRLGPWELAVLDLATGAERVLPGTLGIDDQTAWLTPGLLAYGRAGKDGGKSSIYSVPVDGSAPAEMMIENASSPVTFP